MASKLTKFLLLENKKNIYDFLQKNVRAIKNNWIKNDDFETDYIAKRVSAKELYSGTVRDCDMRDFLSGKKTSDIVFQNVRSSVTAIDYFAKYVFPITLSDAYSVFANGLRKRILRTNSSVKMCVDVDSIPIPGKCGHSNCSNNRSSQNNENSNNSNSNNSENSNNSKSNNSKNNNCNSSITPFSELPEEYAENEIFFGMPSCAGNIFESGTLEETVGQYVAGSSGTSFGVFNLVLSNYDNLFWEEKRVILKYLFIACAARFVPFYHHSLREVFMVYCYFAHEHDEKCLHILKLAWEPVDHNNAAQYETKYRNFLKNIKDYFQEEGYLQLPDPSYEKVVIPVANPATVLVYTEKIQQTFENFAVMLY